MSLRAIGGYCIHPIAWLDSLVILKVTVEYCNMVHLTHAALHIKIHPSLHA